MKTHFQLIILLVIAPATSWTLTDKTWRTENRKEYSIYYTAPDEKNTSEYTPLIDNGLASVSTFFKAPYKKRFDVYIHPNRHSLDSTWQKDWNMPDFKSECWMVASGVAARLDLISPKVWDKQACEHTWSNSGKTQKLITHELVHVFHGQHNPSPDFSNVGGLDWFVEGLATFASGQCDSARIAEVKKAIAENKIPESLDKFWTGNLKYGLSGSMVMYIDQKYGREKLVDLLGFDKKTALLSALKTGEAELLDGWRKYFMQTH